MTHIPLLSWLFNPLVAPALVFGGMLLLAKARESEHADALERTGATLQLIGVPKTPPKRKSVWRTLWLLPLAVFVAFFVVIPINISLYAPPPPTPSSWARFTPPVDPLAYAQYAPASRTQGKATIRQTVIENRGQINGGTLSNNTLIAGPNAMTGIDIAKGANVDGNYNIHDVHFCAANAWVCFIKEEKRNADNNDAKAFENTVALYQSVFEHRSQMYPPQTAEQCLKQYRDAVTLLRDNIGDESETIQSLLSTPPPECIKPPSRR